MPTLLDYLFSAVDGAPGVGPAVTRGGLRVLSWVYGAALEIDLATYPIGLARVTRLPVEVISVGNLSVGGTGKTLAVRRIVHACLAAGRKPAVLSRGYGRASREELSLVITPGEIPALTARDTGDEPFLLAMSMPGVPVVIGKNRRRTGRKAIDDFGADVLVLDDGFQYWRLHKDREIVLLDALLPPARECLLPRGVFREPWSHLRRAHEIWITHAHTADPARVRALAARAARHAPAATLRYTEHHPLHLRSPHGQQAPLQTLHGRHVLAVSGLGNPRQFETTLANLGAHVVPCRFPDHHPFSDADVAGIAAQITPGMLVVTTAKDALRLPPHPPFPVWVVEVELVDVPAPE